MTHLRYHAQDKSWDLDLKIEGFNEEEEAFWSIVLQYNMMLFTKLYPERCQIKEQVIEQ